MALELKSWKTLVHIIGDGTRRCFPFIDLQKGVDQNREGEGCDWLLSKDRVMGKLSPRCLSDTG